MAVEPFEVAQNSASHPLSYCGHDLAAVPGEGELSSCYLQYQPRQFAVPARSP